MGTHFTSCTYISECLQVVASIVQGLQGMVTTVTHNVEVVSNGLLIEKMHKGAANPAQNTT